MIQLLHNKDDEIIWYIAKYRLKNVMYIYIYVCVGDILLKLNSYPIDCDLYMISGLDTLKDINWINTLKLHLFQLYISISIEL